MLTDGVFAAPSKQMMHGPGHELRNGVSGRSR